MVDHFELPQRGGIMLRLRVTVSLQCPHCRESINAHSPNCPAHDLQKLVEKRMASTGLCPVCKKESASVELNAGDFYECRKCHTQFSTAESGSAEEDWTWLTINGEFIIVIVLKDKGKGDFPLDKLFEEARQRLKKKRKQAPT